MPDTQQPDLFLSLAATRAGENAVLGIIEQIVPGLAGVLQQVTLDELGLKARLKDGTTAQIAVVVKDG